MRRFIANCHVVFGCLKAPHVRIPNIKSLKGPFKGYSRFRIGDWRVIYRIDEEHRRDVYE